jgi:hypothetical protein
MHKNTFLTTPDVKKYFFNDLILVVCGNASKHVFNHSRGKKNNFSGLDSGGLEVCANA